jgi:hypothetical protein
MPKATATRCALLLMTACAGSACAVEEEAPFADKGLGDWREMKDAPELVYRALWGVNRREVYAVGDGGVAVGDGGVALGDEGAWRLLEEVPAASYRAVWGRSSSEVWIGGDRILLARAPTGWQRQVLLDGSFEVTEYSVMALGGDEREEYAIVVTGGERLLFVNDGSAWRTALWRADLPGAPLPPEPSAFVRDGQVLVGGAGDLVRCSTTTELGVPMWEAYRWPIGVDLPRLAAVSGGPGFWAGAGGAWVVLLEDGEEDPLLLEVSGGAARAVHARAAGALFAVGDTIEACDRAGCAVELEAPAKNLRAAWGDGAGMVLAAGDGVILARESIR